jgi:hypothetical protein
MRWPNHAPLVQGPSNRGLRVLLLPNQAHLDKTGRLCVTSRSPTIGDATARNGPQGECVLTLSNALD